MAAIFLPDRCETLCARSSHAVRSRKRLASRVTQVRCVARLAILSLVGACSWLDGNSPDADLPPAFITTLESEASIAFVSIGESRAFVRRLPWQGTQVSASATPSHDGVLIVSAIPPAQGCPGNRIVEFFDLATQQSRWRAAFRQPCGTLPFSGLDVLEEGVIAATDGGDTLYVWGGKIGEVPTLSVVTSADFEVVVADSSWERIQLPNALMPVPIVPGYPRGALAVIGLRSGEVGTLETAQLRLLDRQTLAVLDSVPHAVMPFGQRMYAVFPCPESSRLLLVGGSSMVIYDVQARQVVRAANVRAYGAFDLSPGCETMVFGDPGRSIFRDDDGSGFLFIYRNAMQSIDSIDISTPLGGVPFTNSAIRSNGVVMADGVRQAWVRIGHNNQIANPLRQRARLLLVDLESGAILRNVDLGGESSGVLWGNPP